MHLALPKLQKLPLPENEFSPDYLLVFGGILQQRFPHSALVLVWSHWTCNKKQTYVSSLCRRARNSCLRSTADSRVLVPI